MTADFNSLSQYSDPTMKKDTNLFGLVDFLSKGDITTRMSNLVWVGF